MLIQMSILFLCEAFYMKLAQVEDIGQIMRKTKSQLKPTLLKRLQKAF